MNERNCIKSLNRAWGRINRLYSAWESRRGVNHYHLQVLHALYADGEQTQKTISENYQMPKQTVNNAARALKNGGCIIFEPDETDRREKIMKLTKSGEDYARRFVEPLMRLDAEVVRIMGEKSFCRLTKLLESYGNALQKGMEGQK